jgi:hypothetical protein
VAKDWGLEWRLVPARAKESCRWQSVDGAWIALTLGHQKDITKVVVSASDGRSEVVDGYEEGLNLARRWRTTWAGRSSHVSGSGSGSGSRIRPALTEEATQILPRASVSPSPVAALPGRSRLSAGLSAGSPAAPPGVAGSSASSSQGAWTSQAATQAKGSPGLAPVWDDSMHDGPTQPAANSPYGEIFKGIPRRTDPPSSGHSRQPAATPTQITRTWPPGAPADRTGGASTPKDQTIPRTPASPASPTRGPQQGSTPAAGGTRGVTSLTPLVPERAAQPQAAADGPANARQGAEVPPLRRRHTRPPLLPDKDDP